MEVEKKKLRSAKYGTVTKKCSKKKKERRAKEGKERVPYSKVLFECHWGCPGERSLKDIKYQDEKINATFLTGTANYEKKKALFSIGGEGKNKTNDITVLLRSLVLFIK